MMEEQHPPFHVCYRGWKRKRLFVMTSWWPIQQPAARIPRSAFPSSRRSEEGHVNHHGSARGSVSVPKMIRTLNEQRGISRMG